VPKVLYISYDGLTDPLGQSQILPYLRELAKHGFQFTILSFEKKDRFQKEKHIVQAITEEAGIKWVPLYFTKRPPILSKIYDRFKLLNKAFALNKTEKFDMVHCRSYLAAEAGSKLKKKFGVKFLFDMRGFWADERVDNGQWVLNSPFYKRLYKHYKRKEKEFLLQADSIVSLTKAASDYLLSKPEYKHLRIEVIPCCADLDHFDYSRVGDGNIKTVRDSLKIPASSKTIIYLGSVGGWYMITEMFSFFRILTERSPEYVMLILTKDDAEKVRKEAFAAGIPGDKIFITYSNRKRLPEFLALGTFGIFFIRNTFSKIASSPTKHAELMGMGIPVICNDIGDTGNIIRKTNTGIVIDEFSEKSLQCAAERLLQANFNKEDIRRCAREIFDLSSGVKKYLAIYQNLTS
jgi:glycosyltransferase involved in cell wall biosynthesis